MIVTAVGVLAGFLAISFDIPQLYKILRTKNVVSFSVYFLWLKLLMVLSWMVYGLLIKDYTLIFTNAICSIFAIIYLIFFFRYEKS